MRRRAMATALMKKHARTFFHVKFRQVQRYTDSGSCFCPAEEATTKTVQNVCLFTKEGNRLCRTAEAHALKTRHAALAILPQISKKKKKNARSLSAAERTACQFIISSLWHTYNSFDGILHVKTCICSSVVSMPVIRYSLSKRRKCKKIIFAEDKACCKQYGTRGR